MSLRRRLAPALATLLAAAVLPALAATTAQASTWTHRDPAGDAQGFSGTGDDEVIVAAPTNRSADITRVVVAHTPELVRITMKVRDLRSANQFALTSLKLPGRSMALAVLQREGGKTTFDLTTFSEGRCRAASGRLRPQRDVIVTTIPRSCLGDPAWVRVSALYATFEGPIDTAEQGFADDALRTGEAEKNSSAWSPRIPIG